MRNDVELEIEGSFFAALQILYKAMPKAHIMHSFENTNVDFSEMTVASENVYLSFVAVRSRDVLYSFNVKDSHDVIGSVSVWDNCSIIYNSNRIINSHKIFYSS